MAELLHASQRAVLYQCGFCGEVSEDSEEHLHRADDAPAATHPPMRRLYVLIERVEGRP